MRIIDHLPRNRKRGEHIALVKIATNEEFFYSPVLYISLYSKRIYRGYPPVPLTIPVPHLPPICPIENFSAIAFGHVQEIAGAYKYPLPLYITSLLF